jgi:hypothetical protein
MVRKHLVQAVMGLSLALVTASLLVEVPNRVAGAMPAPKLAPLVSCPNPCAQETCTTASGDPGLCPTGTSCPCNPVGPGPGPGPRPGPKPIPD